MNSGEDCLISGKAGISWEMRFAFGIFGYAERKSHKRCPRRKTVGNMFSVEVVVLPSGSPGPRCPAAGGRGLRAGGPSAEAEPSGRG